MLAERLPLAMGGENACRARRLLTSEDTLMNTPTAVQLLRNSLDRFLAKDMKGWSELCDENVVAEFPFAPEGSPAKIEGRTALYEYLRNYPSFIDVRAIPTLNTYATDDPNVAIAEWHASGRVIGSGNPYENELRHVRHVSPRSHRQLSRILESDGVHRSDERNSLRQLRRINGAYS
jgi:uncharacterized protein